MKRAIASALLSPPAGAAAQQCGAKLDEAPALSVAWTCTRERGHEGPHVAHVAALVGGRKSFPFAAVWWSDE